MGRKVKPRLQSPGSRGTGHSEGETSTGLKIDDLIPWIKVEIQSAVNEGLKPLKSDMTELKFLISRLAGKFESDTFEDKKVLPIRLPVKDDGTIQGEAGEELEHSGSQSVRHERSSGKRRKKDEMRNLQLQFKTGLPPSVYTGQKLTIHVELVDANTGAIVKLGLEHSVEAKVVVLEGDFRTQEGFDKFVVKEHEGKRPLLVGNLAVNLNGGTGVLGDVQFTDNSSWTKSGKFRLGLRPLSEYSENISEAITEPFTVKENRGQSNEKHATPAPGDAVWRLKNIARNGPFHKNLSDAGISNVREFLQLLQTDPKKLREILGEKMTRKKWEDLVRHAKTCPLDGKHRGYLDTESDDGRELTDHNADRVLCAADKFSPGQENHGDTIGKASSYFPSQVSERRTEMVAPVLHNKAPGTCAPPVDPEAPPANAASTAEGHIGVNGGLIPPGDNGITTGGLPTQSHDVNSQSGMPSLVIDSSRQMDSIVNGNVLPPGASISYGHSDGTALQLPVQFQDNCFVNPVEFSAYGFARPASRQLRYADNWYGLIAPGDNGFTSGGLPTQSHDVNSQSATYPSMLYGHNHVTALPSQSQSTNIRNFLKSSANEFACSASYQPISAADWTISPGDIGIAIGGLPTQSHDMSSPAALRNQMFSPWRKIDAAVNEVVPSEPPCAPPTEGDHVMQDLQVNVADNTMEYSDLLDFDPSFSDPVWKDGPV